jgi:uncharacterized protein YbjT (DUF2867 family)
MRDIMNVFSFMARKGFTMRSLHAVTGAFGYSGSYIAQQLLDAGHPVLTLTNSPNRDHPLRGQIAVSGLGFDTPEKLVLSMKDVRVLYNTYWVRFNHASFSHADAVANTRTLFRCAAEAGVERIVHVSITNPDVTSPLEYFRGKAILEEDLKCTGVPHTILRPTVLFGPEDILINNIAWALRHLPVFGLFGDGSYKLQPIHVDDLARLAVDAGTRSGNETINAIGPETFTYRDLVAAIGASIGRSRPILNLPPFLAHVCCSVMGKLVRDVIVTRDEIDGLMAGLLEVESPPTGTIRLTDWIRSHADTVGRRYTSELARRMDRSRPYSHNG